MRFRRWPRPTPFADSTRKRAALIRKQRLEREALPLLYLAIAGRHEAGEAIGGREPDPERPPWIFHQEVHARTTPNPVQFDEAFRKIGARKVGGGSKTTAADELLFCCNLGSGMLFLRSRVRLIDPNESFYTCSNHRLRDSHVGRAGHWVEIEVRGECSDDDLALIERLARDADTRPVVVQRVAVLVRRTGEGDPS